MTQDEIRDAYDHARDFLAEDAKLHDLTSIERALCESVIGMYEVICENQEALQGWYDDYAEVQQENATMRDFLRTLRERAQNDINIRTKQGQHVGSLTFASLQGAREVRAVCDALTKVGDTP